MKIIKVSVWEDFDSNPLNDYYHVDKETFEKIQQLKTSHENNLLSVTSNEIMVLLMKCPKVKEDLEVSYCLK